MSDPVEVSDQRSLPSQAYSPSQITLFGVPLSYLDFPTFGTSAPNIRLQIYVAPLVLQIVIPGVGPIVLSPFREVALIYGYGYQGHCYSFAEPAILLVDPATRQLAQGCGFDPALGYQMWSAEKLDNTVHLQVTQDFFEEVVLRRNMGTSKQPISYHSAMKVSHRGGKLMD
jgi:hypothetical protein